MRFAITCKLLTFLSLAMFAADAFPPPAELPAQSTPPDPLVMLSGERITSKDGWFTKRVPELRQLFQYYEYGGNPSAPEGIDFTILHEDAKAFGGKATLKEVRIAWETPKSRPIYLLVVVPNKRDKPAAVFLGLNFTGNHTLVSDPKVRLPDVWMSERAAGADNRAGEEDRGKHIETWSIEQTIDRGYAVATLFNGDVVSDKAEAAAEEIKAFLPEGRTAPLPHDTATIAVWAWCLQRGIDYLVSDGSIDPRRIAVVGHSRNGKTALLAAAMDERIALAIPSQAGCGGTAPCRVPADLAKPNEKGRPTAETLAVINKNFPHWFCGYFKEFNDAPEKLPFDQHALIALCAPRPVLLSNATEDLWAYPSGQFDMLRAADPVYRLIAGEGCDATQMPETNQLLASRLGFFIRPGKHAMTAVDWKEWLDYADRWLK